MDTSSDSMDLFPPTQSNEHPIVVIGAGPVGLTLALALNRFGCQNVHLVEQNAQFTADSKALMVNARTQEILSCLQVLEPFLDQGSYFNQVKLIDSNKKMQSILIDQFPPHMAYPYGLFISQAQTQAILQEEVLKTTIHFHPGVKLVGVEKDEALGQYVLSFDKDGQIFKQSQGYFVSCEGAHSTIRHFFQSTGYSQFEGIPDSGSFVVCDCALKLTKTPFTEDIGPGQLMVQTHKTKTIMCFFYSQNRMRLLIRENEKTDYLPSQQEINEMLTHSFDSGLQVEDPEYKHIFNVQERCSTQFQKDNLFIAGDAAHVHSPAGGQGLNAGMHDAFNLAWKLAYLSKGIHTQAVETYQQERQYDDHLLVKQVSKLTAALSSESFLKWIAFHWALPIAKHAKTTKIQLNKMLSGITGHSYNYPHSWFISLAQRSQLESEITHLQDFFYKDQSGQVQSFFHALNHRLFTLLVWTKKSKVADLRAWEEQIERYRKMYEKYPVLVLGLAHSMPKNRKKYCLWDDQHFYAQNYKADKGVSFYRPDHYQAFYCLEQDPENKITQYLHQLFPHV